MAQNLDSGKKGSEDLRLRLQLETTLLAHVNTSLALMGFGFVVARFGLFLREIAQVSNAPIRHLPHLATMNSLTGTVFILLGVAVLLLSVLSYRNSVNRLERGDWSLPSWWSLGVVLSLILATLGVWMAVYLAGVEI